MSAEFKRNVSKERKKRKPKKKRGIKSTKVYKFLTANPLLPNRWPGGSSPVCPPPREHHERETEAVELGAIVQDLKRRIAAIPLRNRPVPKTVDPYLLGVELKLRLAAKAPILVEKTERNRQVRVERGSAAQRRVPIYHINKNSDCHVICHVRIDRRSGNIKRIIQQKSSKFMMKS